MQRAVQHRCGVNPPHWPTSVGGSPYTVSRTPATPQPMPGLVRAAWVVQNVEPNSGADAERHRLRDPYWRGSSEPAEQRQGSAVFGGVELDLVAGLTATLPSGFKDVAITIAVVTATGLFALRSPHRAHNFSVGRTGTSPGGTNTSGGERPYARRDTGDSRAEHSSASLGHAFGSPYPTDSSHSRLAEGTGLH